MIADKGYDSDPLRERLRRRGVTLIAPHRSMPEFLGHAGVESAYTKSAYIGIAKLGNPAAHSEAFTFNFF